MMSFLIFAIQDEKDKQHLISKLGEYAADPKSKPNNVTTSTVYAANERKVDNKVIPHVPEKSHPPPGIAQVC